MRTPKPWYRKDRKSWFVTINGQRYNLGRDRVRAFERFYALMAEPSPSPVVQAESVLAIIDAFLEWTRKHRAERTYDWYRERCQSFVDAIPDICVRQLKPYHVQQWLDSRPHWSNGHKRGHITALMRAFNWAYKMGYCPQNPIASIEKPPAGKRDLVIAPREYQAILSHTRDQAFSDLVTIAWETGCRPQEAWTLEARHVDRHNSRWIIPLSEAKGKTYPRIVYLTDTALEITLRNSLRFPDGTVFRNSQGRPWTRFAVNCRFERLEKKLGVKYFLYAFRHSFATRMLETGVDALTVAILLGHQNPAMLSSTYQHLSHNPEFLLRQLRRAC